MAIPNKVSERLGRNISRFQNILKQAKDRDVNEADTVLIVTDILSEVFGYDKYTEVTRELAIKGTFCDLAIKIDGNFQYLIEVKAIGTDLKDNHLKQVIDYGANKGIPWVILTNGITWSIYKIRFEQPIGFDLVCNIDFLSYVHRKEDDQEKMYLICKEGLTKDTREEFFERTQSLNKFVVGNLLLCDSVLSSIRKELKRIFDGVKVENQEIENILKTDVIKRDIFEGDDAKKASSKIKRTLNKLEKQKVKNTEKSAEAAKEENGARCSAPPAETGNTDQ